MHLAKSGESKENYKYSNHLPQAKLNMSINIMYFKTNYLNHCGISSSFWFYESHSVWLSIFKQNINMAAVYLPSKLAVVQSCWTTSSLDNPSQGNRRQKGTVSTAFSPNIRHKSFSCSLDSGLTQSLYHMSQILVQVHRGTCVSLWIHTNLGELCYITDAWILMTLLGTLFSILSALMYIQISTVCTDSSTMLAPMQTMECYTLLSLRSYCSFSEVV